MVELLLGLLRQTRRSISCTGVAGLVFDVKLPTERRVKQQRRRRRRRLWPWPPKK